MTRIEKGLLAIVLLFLIITPNIKTMDNNKNKQQLAEEINTPPGLVTVSTFLKACMTSAAQSPKEHAAQEDARWHIQLNMTKSIAQSTIEQGTQKDARWRRQLQLLRIMSGDDQQVTLLEQEVEEFATDPTLKASLAKVIEDDKQVKECCAEAITSLRWPPAG